jgi:hypothetical protein
MNRREVKQYASEHPAFKAWAEKHYKQIPLKKRGDYSVWVDKWKESSKTLNERFDVRPLAESMQDVQDFVHNMQTFFEQVKTLRDKAKNP